MGIEQDSSAISEGTSINTGPGRPFLAIENARCITQGVVSGETIRVAHLVTGRMNDTESSSWKAPLPSEFMGVPLLKAMTGSDAECASSRAVAILVIPGPGLP